MIRNAIRPEVDRAAGPAGPLVRLATGTEEYEDLRDTLANETVSRTMAPLRDPEFNEARSGEINELLSERLRGLSSEEFVSLLRPAFVEDEWMLVVLGGLLGFVAGWLQLLVVSAV